MYTRKRVTATGYFRSRQVLLVVVVLITVTAIAWWILHSEGPQNVNNADREWNDLKVAQFYLHMPAGDTIIGRSNSKFNDISTMAQNITNSIYKQAEPKASLPGMLQDDVAKKLFRENICLSIWLTEQQMINTKIKAKGQVDKDKANYQILKADRLVIMLGGEQQGIVFLKEPEKETWSAWETERSSLGVLIEFVRKGGI